MGWNEAVWSARWRNPGAGRTCAPDRRHRGAAGRRLCAAGLLAGGLWCALTGSGVSWGQATATAAAEPSTGVGRAPGGRWEKEVAALEAADRALVRSGGIAFIGSSNIRLWTSLAADFPGWHVVGRGVGGCHLHELVPVVHRLVGHSRPDVLVVSAGINDLHAGRSPEQVATAFADLVKTVRAELPRTRIVFLAIAPSFARWDQRDEQARANALVREFIASGRGGPGLGSVDAGAAYLRPDGLPAPECFVDDGLHPTRLGYARRAARLRPLLEPFLVP